MNLKITVTPFEKNLLKGYANITIDEEYALENVQIANGMYGNYVILPKYYVAEKDKKGNVVLNENGSPKLAKKDVFHPITAEAQKFLSESVLKEYDLVMKEGKEKHKDGSVYNYPSEFKITTVNTTPFDRSDDNIIGFGNVVFGEFVLERVKIKEGENGIYLDLPKSKRLDKSGESNEIKYHYKDLFHPITAEAHAELKNALVDNITPKLTLEESNAKSR